jgi:hypothetical protein
MTLEPKAASAQDLQQRAVSLLKSLKGVLDARVDVDALRRIVRVEVVSKGLDERQAARNAQSALMVVLGEYVDVNRVLVLEALTPVREAVVAPPPPAGAEVLELKPATPRWSGRAASGPLLSGAEALEAPARKTELNEAARVAFETLRAAQSSFHGFQFDGAELVRINTVQYVVVAVKRAQSDVRHCGAAPVTESVSAASARALLNAVGAAAMNSVQLELNGDSGQYDLLQA